MREPRRLLIGLIVISLVQNIHGANCCVGYIPFARGNLQISSFSQNTVTWSLSFSVQGDWTNKTMLSDTDNSGEMHLHLFDTVYIYDRLTNTTTFSDSAEDSWSPIVENFPNETWHIGLYFATNASIVNFLNGYPQILQLSTPNYSGNYSSRMMQCTPPSEGNETCYGGVKDPFANALPRGYYFPYVYNTSVFVWRNPDIVKQLSASQFLVSILTYLVSPVLALMPTLQVALLRYSSKKLEGHSWPGVVDSTFFTVGIGILFFLPIYALSLNPLTSPIFNSPLQIQLNWLTEEISLIVSFGLIVFIARRVWNLRARGPRVS